MTNDRKITIIKLVHTAIWLFFNVVIFYMLYAVLFGQINTCLWVGYGLIALETLVLLVFKFFCPLTILARKYSRSTSPNFDIYLPPWLAKYNKQIYTVIMIIIIGLTVYRLL